MVFPPFDDKRDRAAYYVAPPLGILTIAAYLERASFSVEVHDHILDLRCGRISVGPTLYDQCAERILAGEPDVVGFSMQCTTSPGALNIARRIKERRPSTCVLLGGHDVSFLATEYLDAFEFVDFVLAGEAELTAPRLMAALSGQARYEDVPGLAYRRPGGQTRRIDGSERVVDLDSILRPSYHLVDPMERYFELSERPVVLIDSGRGCSFRCAFCQSTLMSGGGVRYRSPDSLVTELSTLCSRHGPFEAYFVHDLFTARRSFVEQLCHRLVDARLPVTWQCRCRVDQVDAELARLMYAAGCRRLLFGVESGSEAALRTVGKGLRHRSGYSTLDCVRDTVEAGILPSLSMVVGMPEESLEDLGATMRLAADFSKLGKVNTFIQLMSPLPGTAVGETAGGRLQYRGGSSTTAFSQGIEFEGGRRLAEDEALISSLPRIFQSFYSIIPEHGDLDLDAEVSSVYCKLLEVYRYTFERLVDALECSELALFQRFRSFVGNRASKGALQHASDWEIWRWFQEFAAGLLQSSDTPDEVLQAYRYECAVHELAVGVPFSNQVHDDVILLALDGTPFRLREGVRHVCLSSPAPWESGTPAPGPGIRHFLLFMTKDRLNHAEIPAVLGESLEVLAQLDRPGSIRSPQYAVLARLLAPLAEHGVFARAAQ